MGTLGAQAKTVYNVFKLVKTPISYLYDYCFNPIEKTYELKNGMRVNLATRTDRLFFHEIWIHHIYTREFDVEQGDIVFDVGSQRGMFSIYASRNAAVVYAFEPMPDTYVMLTKNLKQNRIKNVQPMKLALSSKKGVMKLHLHATHTGSHTLYNHYGKGKTVNVKTETLQNFMDKHRVDHIDFLKMDCEGAEVDILFNLPVAKLKKIRKIAMEYHDNITGVPHTKIVQFLRKNGFTVVLHEENTVMTAQQDKRRKRRA